MAEQKFYVVWNPNGSAPTVRHETLESAKAEAERLARSGLTYPGSKFYVLLSLSVTQRVDVQTVDLAADLPF